MFYASSSFTLSGQVLAAFFERIAMSELTTFQCQSADSAAAYPPNLVGVEKFIRKYQCNAPYLPLTSRMVSTENFIHLKNALTAAE